MNNRRSASEQLIFNFLLSFLAVWFIFQYLHGPQQKAQVPPRQAKTVAEAFAGIATTPRLSKAQAQTEVIALQKNIALNPDDGLAQWSRLRLGLIQQYVLGLLAPVTIPGGLVSRPWQGTVYDEIAHHQGTADI